MTLKQITMKGVDGKNKENHRTHCSSSLAFKEKEPTAVMAAERKEKKKQVNVNVQTGEISF